METLNATPIAQKVLHKCNAAVKVVKVRKPRGLVLPMGYSTNYGYFIWKMINYWTIG
jgi:hypothetical protein